MGSGFVLSVGVLLRLPRGRGDHVQPALQRPSGGLVLHEEEVG